jgi:hypothetical protein
MDKNNTKTVNKKNKKIYEGGGLKVLDFLDRCILE